MATAEVKIKVTAETEQARRNMDALRAGVLGVDKAARAAADANLRLSLSQKASAQAAAEATEMMRRFADGQGRAASAADRSVTAMGKAKGALSSLAHGASSAKGAFDVFSNALVSLPGALGIVGVAMMAGKLLVDKFTGSTRDANKEFREWEERYDRRVKYEQDAKRLESTRNVSGQEFLWGSESQKYDRPDVGALGSVGTLAVMGANLGGTLIDPAKQITDAVALSEKRATLAKKRETEANAWEAEAKARRRVEVANAGLKWRHEWELGLRERQASRDEDADIVRPGPGWAGMAQDALSDAGAWLGEKGDQAREWKKGGDASRQAQASEKFLANLEDQTSKTGAAFSALSSGMAASVEAAITGSQSIGQAFKNAAAAALKATAVESTIKALYHTAAGVGSIALGPIGGVSAAAHFKAAGLYAATALAAGAASAGLGGGGGGGGGYAGAGAGGGGYSRPSQGGGDGGSIINITIGHGFVGDEQKLGAEIHKAVASARRSGRARDSSVISHD